MWREAREQPPEDKTSLLPKDPNRNYKMFSGEMLIEKEKESQEAKKHDVARQQEIASQQEIERQQEIAWQQAVARQQEMRRQQEITRQQEIARQQEMRRQEEERKLEMKRQEEMVRQQEVASQQEVAKKLEIERQQAILRQQEMERQQQLAMQEEMSRQLENKRLEAMARQNMLGQSTEQSLQLTGQEQDKMRIQQLLNLQMQGPHPGSTGYQEDLINQIQILAQNQLVLDHHKRLLVEQVSRHMEYQHQSAQLALSNPQQPVQKTEDLAKLLPEGTIPRQTQNVPNLPAPMGSDLVCSQDSSLADHDQDKELSNRAKTNPAGYEYATNPTLQDSREFTERFVCNTYVSISSIQPKVIYVGNCNT